MFANCQLSKYLSIYLPVCLIYRSTYLTSNSHMCIFSYIYIYICFDSFCCLTLGPPRTSSQVTLRRSQSLVAGGRRPAQRRLAPVGASSQSVLPSSEQSGGAMNTTFARPWTKFICHLKEACQPSGWETKYECIFFANWSNYVLVIAVLEWNPILPNTWEWCGILAYLIACGKPAGHSHVVHYRSLRRSRRPWPGPKQGQCVCLCVCVKAFVCKSFCVSKVLWVKASVFKSVSV